MKRPNVIWLLLDALRYDRVGCCTDGSQLTPHIDEIAAESAVFTKCIAQSNYSDPTHATIFTGLYPFETAAPPAGHGLRRDVTTIAEAMQASGWRTAVMSANPMLWDTENHGRGFDETHRIKLLGADSYSPIGRLSAMFLGDKGAYRMAELLPTWADQVQEPFFAFANFMDVHQPYGAHYRHSRRLFPGIGGWLRQKRLMLKTMRLHNFIADATDVEIEGLRDLYDTAVMNLDEAVGRCVARLRELRLLDNSVLVMTSDHGNYLGEGGRVAHSAAMGEHVLHVPLIIRWPEVWRQGTVIDQVVEQRCIPSSLCELVGVDQLGESCLPRVNLFELGDIDEDAFAYAERIPLKPESRQRYEKVHPKFDWDRFDRHFRVVRDSDWELIRSTGDLGGLYRVSDDPDETTDLTGDYPEIERRLAAKMTDMRKLSDRYRAERDVDGEHYTTEERRKIEDHLRSYGYL